MTTQKSMYQTILEMDLEHEKNAYLTDLDVEEEQQDICQCGSTENVEFVEIVNTYLCEECNKELADSFEYAMNNRYDELPM